MALGINRSDPNNGGTSYRSGSPVTLPHNFGNPVTTPVNFGNPIPSDGKNVNTVNWVPSPAHFGNTVGPPAPTGPALVAHTIAGSNGTGSVTTTAINTTGSGFLILVVTPESASDAITVADSKSNTWHQVSLPNGRDFGSPLLYYAFGATVGTGHTFTVSATNGVLVSVAAFSGVKSSADPFESANNQNSVESGVTAQPGNVTPVAVKDLIFSGFGGFSNPLPVTINDSFVEIDSLFDSGTGIPNANAYLVATATTVINPTWTATSNPNRLASCIAVFAHA